MTTDFLIIGAGVAGLRAAIEAAEAGRVLVLTKDRLTESASEYAQGGVAVALSDDDEVRLHEQDTIQAGDGLCDPQAVRVLVEEGPAVTRQLIEWGTRFDRVAGDGARLAFTREGAHSRSRVLHAHGDSTGHEIARALFQKAQTLPDICFRSYATTIDLLLAEGEVCGASVWNAQERRVETITARAVLLATGGLGAVYSETTNPDVATGDGVAMAYRCGAEISDLEFVQFHPTALHVEGAPRFLLSEALRGEGAYLHNAAGERFMARYSPQGELAARDVVSRAIVAELKRTGAPHVFLDLTHLDASFVRRRFPRIYDTCLRYGVDMTREPVPTHPAAHYAMGGVKTDLYGRTTVEGLYAAGEVAATGVHGANRLASNSLLEGLVFGARVGRQLWERADAPLREPQAATAHPELPPGITNEEIRALAWSHAGIERNGRDLEDCVQRLEGIGLQPGPAPTRAGFELRNRILVVSLIARCALAREESRGGHFRRDYPEKRLEFQKHSCITKSHDVRFA
ncbi:MAG: L-aspartate oxidase [Acidobacteria bacterium]|nr:L-aspartate oxidase [Acidobacteriota bacterium]